MTDLMIHWMDGGLRGACTNQLPLRLSRRWLSHLASKGYTKMSIVYDPECDTYHIQVWEGKVKITATKQVTVQGSSLVLILTKELKKAGFRKGDMVTITIEPREEEL